MSWLLIPLFFLSGATSLVGEVVWMRMLGLVVGNTVWAASAVVAVWMGGMAVGARLGAALAPRTRRHLRWYGASELLIGVFFAASGLVERGLLHLGTLLGPDLGGALAGGVALRLALAVAGLALPTVLMGLTLPLVVERLRGAGLAARVGVLYGVNTLGATTGVFLAAYVLLPRLGESGTLAAAALCCGLVAAAAVAAEGTVPEAPPPPPAEDALPSRHLGFMLIVGSMGAAALAAELVWVRLLVLHLGSRVYAFAVLLGVYLLGIALGSLAVRGLAPRLNEPRRTLAAVQLGVAAALAVQVIALGHTGDLLAALATLLNARLQFATVQLVTLSAVVILFLPVTVLLGASFPLAVAADPGSLAAGSHTGRVAAANTVGGIIGALAAPFLLIPLVGSQRTLLILVLIHLGVATALRRRWPRLAGSAVAIAAVLLWWLLPADWVIRQSHQPGGSDLLQVRESLTATVLVKRYHDPGGDWLSLELNGVNVAGTSPALLAVQQLQGQLPLLQARHPRRVLHVGFGSGGTCWAVTRHPVQRVDVVEISPEVLETADHSFADVNHHVLSDPRVHVIVNDGRNYLLASDAMYDVILSDSIHPVYAGNSTLYTEEYFRLCRRHLAPDGVVSMWLPLYSLDRESYLRILAAFHQVFPRTAVWRDLSTVNESTVVTGLATPGPLRLAWGQLAEPGVAASLAIAGVHGPADLAADLLLGPEQVSRLVAGVEPHVDDLPFVEYVAGRVMIREGAWLDNLSMLYGFRTRQSPFAELPVAWPEVAARRDRVLRRQLHTLERSLKGDG